MCVGCMQMFPKKELIRIVRSAEGYVSLDFKGKAVPAIMNVRKYFKQKKQEKIETAETLKAVKILLQDVNDHYSADNIAKRDSWMQWVNDRAVTYDRFIEEMGEGND